MRVTILKILLCVSYSLFTLAACTRDNGVEHYNDLVDTEIASGKRVDSIFFGIYFGMSTKNFFAHCWKMNKKGLFTDGRSNTAVLYRLNHNELKYPASMNFYPEMKEGKINKMSVAFQYDAWAPWNKHLFSDSLLIDVLEHLKKWHKGGNPFIQITTKGNPIYVKVDGNRRILIKTTDDKDVMVEYTDLLTEPKRKN